MRQLQGNGNLSRVPGNVKNRRQKIFILLTNILVHTGRHIDEILMGGMHWILGHGYREIEICQGYQQMKIIEDRKYSFLYSLLILLISTQID